MWLSLNSDLGIDIRFLILICIFGVNSRTCEGGLKNNVQINRENVRNGSRDWIQETGQQIVNHNEEEEDDEDFGEHENDKELDSKSLIEFVENMESEARHGSEGESLGIVPKIYEYFTTGFKTAKPSKNSSNLDSRHKPKNERTIPGELDLPEDFSDTYFEADVVDDIAAGVEESLAISGRENPNKDEKPSSNPENREFAFYMFQGQYIAEPRLNLFVDGAIRNLAGEMKLGVMDPLYFRVLPRGRVTSRLKPQRQGLQGLNMKNQLNTKPGKNQRVRRRRPIRRRRRKQGVGVGRRKATEKRNPKQRIFQEQRRRQAAKARRRRQRNQQRRRQAQKKIRRQRKASQGVGSGRVEGLSNVQRDGDAEMQMFGNYTMIRCHAKMGPVVLNMQFRTRRGLRRTGATLPEIKIHSVTRVSPAGSEMVDFILDRPHPETIKLRGKLFPLAERVAKNIFARLFMPGSFLVSRIREKSAAALLSKPKIVSYG